MSHQPLAILKTVVLAALLLPATAYLISCNQPAEANEVSISGKISIPKLLDRKSNTGPKEEQEQIRKMYTDAIAALKLNPDDPKQYITLATVFITEGRITGNTGYYSNAAAAMLDRVMKINPSDKNLVFEALSLKSAVLLNMHQFKEALSVAEQGRKINDFNAGIYGALVDANVEMGQYQEAVKDCDKMISIRPDLRSYSRASYLRQIYGDNNGAIEAMKMAVEAGVPGLENTEWARVTCGDLYANTGKLDTAAMIYESALAYRPGYPYAEMGLARVAAARKDYDKAILHTRNAISNLSEASFVSYLGDMYLLKGDKAKAMEIYKDVVTQLEAGEKEQASYTGIQHNGHRELAMAYLNISDFDKALQHATADYNMRPANIDANDLMAWVLYRKGDYAAAQSYATRVAQSKSKNANQLFKAGLIYTAAGNADKGDALRKEAAGISAFIDPRITTASTSTN
jgi:tetratricopeptide (TPR) repeat protein